MIESQQRPKSGPTYMSKEQMAHYLTDLRSTKLARPSGSRPAPPSRYASVKRSETDLSKQNLVVSEERPTLHGSTSMPVLSSQPQMHKRSESSIQPSTVRSPFAGRPLVKTPIESIAENDGQQSRDRPSSMSYRDSGARWMEKQEARSLRMALQDMDLETERRVHNAAQDEAAELVWKHRNPDAVRAESAAPKVNPDIQRDYRAHLRKGSYQRSHSQDSRSTSGHRSASDGSQHSNSSVDAAAMPMPLRRKVSPPSGILSMAKQRQTSGKSYDGLAAAVAGEIAVAHRRISSGSKRLASGSRRLMMDPSDRIWEDPQAEATPPRLPPPRTEAKNDTAALPAYIRKNPFARVRMQQERMERSNSAPALPTAPILPPPTSTTPRLDRVEIQRNPPSQSRNPWYMSNRPLVPTPPSTAGHRADEVSPKVTPTKEGKEIRSDEIRSATSKQRKDYSPRLPRPTLVSDKPERPIVSFQSREVNMQEVRSAAPPAIVVEPAGIESTYKAPVPQINFPDGPALPTIILPEEPDFTIEKARADLGNPTFNIEPPSISINAPESETQRTPAQAASHSVRPLPHHATTAPLPQYRSTPHYTPAIRQSGALCAHCALPIAGRILTAAGERFHPNCFVCHQCNTNLECVAFYPEPEKHREERLERIYARQHGHPVPGDVSEQQEDQDGDPTLRFYCHLDFHELFSPRCKSCKTPIEGEVIVACGAEWHAGHFFCAQCGDPFDSTMPFVEKDGYAWCVGCHTNRYSPKCKGCRKPVTDVVVKALGADWHGSCFVCMECKAEFDDGRYFLRGDSQDPVCVKCEERRLKA